MGWRARLGLVVPSSNTTAEPEIEAYTPAAVSVHGARMSLESVTADALDSMAADAEQAATLLGHADVDAVAYACTTGSLLHGPGFDAELEETIATAAGAPAVATALSVDRALSALGARRIAVATPYVEDLDERERDYLEAAGYEVVAMDGRGLAENTAIGALRPGDAYRQARAVVERAEEQQESDQDGNPIDAVFISCTNYRTLPVVETLEADLGVPVVTSNLATLWDVTRAAGISIDGPGTLFETNADSNAERTAKHHTS